MFNTSRDTDQFLYVGTNAHHRVTPIVPLDGPPCVQGGILDRPWWGQPQEQAEVDNEEIIDLQVGGAREFNVVSHVGNRVVHDDDHRHCRGAAR